MHTNKIFQILFELFLQTYIRTNRNLLIAKVEKFEEFFSNSDIFLSRILYSIKLKL